MEIHPKVLFNEPDGRRIGLVYMSASAVCFLGYVYYGILHDGSNFLLALGSMNALFGFAESLPKDRRRLAGGVANNINLRGDRDDCPLRTRTPGNGVGRGESVHPTS